MILTVARHEFATLRRDARYQGSVFFMLVLFAASTGFGWRHYTALTAQAQLAAEHDYQRWRSQDPTHPHIAAHYGSYAFKTPRPLTIIDPGIQPYTGAAVFYGAHHPNEMDYPPAQDATALQRFGELGVGDCVRVLLPLLTILLTFNTFAGEREQGTLRQLLSLGTKPSTLLWGKALGIALALAVVLLPAGVCGFISAGLLADEAQLSDELCRAGLLIALYVAYLGIFLLLSLAVSAHCRNSRASLITLLVFWLVTVFALPRGLLDWGASKTPSPGAGFAKEFADALAKASEDGSSKALDKLLAQYRITDGDTGKLPVDFVGLYMKAADEGGYPVIDDYYNRRFGTYAQQNAYLVKGSLLSPAAGLNLLSMALTGNDSEQHRAFAQQVENQRRRLNDTLTAYMVAHNEKRQDPMELKGDEHLWEQVPPFRYQPPSWRIALTPYRFSLAALAVWLLLSWGYARYAVSRLRPD